MAKKTKNKGGQKKGVSKASAAKGRGAKTTAPVLSPALQTVFSQGLAMHRAGKLGAAAQAYQQVLQDAPLHADSLHLLGLVAQASGDLSTARELVRRAITSNAQVAAYHFNYGVLVQGLDQLGEAVDSYRRAIRLKPDYLQAYENLAVAQQDRGEYPAAKQACEQALALNPESLIALRNLATLLFRDGETSAALSLFERALRISPADPELHEKRSGCLLRLGQFAAAWQDYRWRFNNPQTWLDASLLRSSGLRQAVRADLKSARVLVAAEQGLGDQIMFASCYADVIDDAPRLVIEQNQRLLPLFERSFPKVRFVAVGDYDPADFDCQLRCGELPSWYRNDETAFPGTPYLYAGQAKATLWRQRLDALPGMKIGIAWRGGKEQRAAQARSIPLKDWQSLFNRRYGGDTAPVFIPLQYDINADEERQIAGSDALHRFDDLDLRDDVDSLAALIAELDLVISVDNTIAHLAGALGKTTWLLLPKGPDRRWIDGRDSSPWYRSVQIFRNPAVGRDGWRSVFVDIAERLVSPLARLEVPVRDDRPAAPAAPRADPATTVLFLNDTSDWYHWGCSGTSLAIHQQLRRRYGRVDSLPIALANRLSGVPAQAGLFDDDHSFAAFEELNPLLCERLSRADAVVMNGEGSLHGLNETSSRLLYLAHIAARRFNKPVHIINHSCYPAEADLTGRGELADFYRHIYRDLTSVAIREPISFRLMQEMGIEARQSFDCLPLFIDHCRAEGSLPDADCVHNAAGPVVMAGCVNWQGAAGEQGIQLLATLARQLRQRGREVQLLLGASASLAGDDIEFSRQFAALAGDDVELVFADSELAWLQTIGRAAVLVSGRFHHSIAAAFLNTPLLVAQSNTPKIAGLLESLAMPEALFEVHGENPAARLLESVDARLSGGDAYLLPASRRRHLLELGMNNFAF